MAEFFEGSTAVRNNFVKGSMFFEEDLRCAMTMKFFQPFFCIEQLQWGLKVVFDTFSCYLNDPN